MCRYFNRGRQNFAEHKIMQHLGVILYASEILYV